MLRPFRTALHNLCSNVWNVPAIQRCVQQSSVWARRQTCRPATWRQSPSGCDIAHDPDANCAPTRLTRRDNWRQPKSFSTASAWSATVPRLVWHHRDLEYLLHGHGPPRSNRVYRPKCATFCRLFSCPHRSPAAPFFRRLGTLAVQDTGTGFGMASDRTTQLFTQHIVNAFPCSILAPVAKIGVDRFPSREIMRQSTPLATCPQGVQNG